MAVSGDDLLLRFPTGVDGSNLSLAASTSSTAASLVCRGTPPTASTRCSSEARRPAPAPVAVTLRSKTTRRAPATLEGVSIKPALLQEFYQYRRSGSNRHGALAPPDFESCPAGPLRPNASGNLAYLCEFWAIREIALSSAYGPVLARLQYGCSTNAAAPA